MPKSKRVDDSDVGFLLLKDFKGIGEGNKLDSLSDEERGFAENILSAENGTFYNGMNKSGKVV